MSWSRVTARNAQQCQGTFVRTATTLVVAPVVAWLPLLPPTEKGKEWLTMPRLRRPLCRHLSALPPLSLSRVRARDSRQWRQGANSACRRCPCAPSSVLRFEPSSGRAVKPSSPVEPTLVCPAIEPSSHRAIEHSGLQAVELSSCQAVELSRRQAVKRSSRQAVKPLSR